MSTKSHTYFYVWGAMSLMIILLGIIFYISLNYIEIGSRYLWVKNTMLLRNKKIELKSIQKVSLNVNANQPIQVIEDNGKKYLFYTRIMSDNFMLCELVNDLRARGIEVDFPHEIEDDVARQKRSRERQRQWKERMRQKKQDNNNKTQTL